MVSKLYIWLKKNGLFKQSISYLCCPDKHSDTIKKFNIPSFYKSSFIGTIKEKRQIIDPRKKDFSPTLLDFGPVQFYIARHFGFCYGVENAIEISYRALEENPDKKVYLLSQMIHNQVVNNDLQSRGVTFIMDTDGSQIIPWTQLKKEDIVIVPAFGTTIEIENKLADIGIEVKSYNTTCPFVERVWKRADQLGKNNCTIIIHGKPEHEETRATFSHSKDGAKSIVVRNMEEAKVLGEIILGTRDVKDFTRHFEGQYSPGFDPKTDLKKVGVINQTTMLATETQAIADYFKSVMELHYPRAEAKEHFADTRDTLCYATNDNQDATKGLLKEAADIAIVVGGYNSSNTSHIVELCEQKFPTYFINSASEITENGDIDHFNFRSKLMEHTADFFPKKSVTKIILTSGASCPDALVDEVLDKILSFFELETSKEAMLAQIN